MKYNKEILEEAVKNSNTIADVCRYLKSSSRGGTFKIVKKYIKLYNIDISHFLTRKEIMKKLSIFNKIPDVEVYVENSKYVSTNELKKRLLKDGLKNEKCEACGIGDEWMGKKLVLQLDHINGVSNDNRLENLRIICPNCHSQTDTFAGKKSVTKNDIKKEERKSNGGFTNSQMNKFNNSRKVERPSKNDLYEMLKVKNFSQLSREFGVSDNAIRKWCIQYKIPSKSKYYRNL